MPMSGVRSQLLPLHGELSTRSLAPAASTAGWFASMASAGSLEPLGRYGVAGLPTVTLLSGDAAVASVGTARAAVKASNATRMTERRTIVSSSPRGDLGGAYRLQAAQPSVLLSPAATRHQGRTARHAGPSGRNRRPNSCPGTWSPAKIS